MNQPLRFSLLGNRLPALDIFRGVAALTIVLHHFISCVATPHFGSPLAYFARVFSLGWVAVDAFFVLSGYLIGSMLLKDRGTSGYYSRFFIRRACRVLPLYLVLLVIYTVIREVAPATAILSHATSDPIPAWSYWCFIQNMFMASHETLGHSNLALTWSLAVEEQFYLIIPFLVAICSLRTLPWILAVGIISALLLRAATGGTTAYVLLPTRMDALLAGVLLAVAIATPATHHWIRANRRYLVFGAVILGCVGASWILLGRNRFHGTSEIAGPMMIWAWIASFLILAAIVTSESDDQPRHLKWMFSALRWIGLRAYGIYLLHPWAYQISWWFAGLESPRLTETEGWLPTLGALLITSVLAEISYRWMEIPIMSFGRNLNTRPQSQQSVPAT